MAVVGMKYFIGNVEQSLSCDYFGTADLEAI